MTIKSALSESMRLAAAYSNRVHTLLAIAQEMPESQFERLVGQTPKTIERDLQSARDDFERIKSVYEKHCAEIGESAYATYNED